MAVLRIKNENGEFVDIPAIKGKDGVGVPTGGSSGQIISKKTDADYDTQWIDLPTKTSDLNNDSNFISSTDVTRIAVVTEYPTTEVEGTLYLKVIE